MEYIDLSLPSGTLWADANEDDFYTFDEAVSKYGDSLPTREQLEELKDHCKWEWIGNGYNVTGPNGNTIVLPAEGYRSDDGNVYHVNYCGYYWSSSPYGSYDALYIAFNAIGVEIFDDERCYGNSVRLVK